MAKSKTDPKMIQLICYVYAKKKVNKKKEKKGKKKRGFYPVSCDFQSLGSFFSHVGAKDTRVSFFV